jgi:GNAT superfamily N-acetyltransferase
MDGRAQGGGPPDEPVELGADDESRSSHHGGREDEPRRIGVGERPGRFGTGDARNGVPTTIRTPDCARVADMENEAACLLRPHPMALSRPVTLNLNGYTDLPPGKIAAVVTFLEMRARPRLRRLEPKPAWSLQRITDDGERFRTLFRSIGEDLMWFSRLVIPDDALMAIIGHPQVESWALVENGRDIGLLELDFRESRECELSFFGLVPEAIGRGAGRFLMNEAIRRAFRRPIRRLYLHTCSLDHPEALAFYLRAGFTPYKRAIEVADDPRLKGLLPRSAAPQIPVIGGAGTTRTRRIAARPGSSRSRKI